MVLDATKRAEQRALLEAELDSVGIRLNKEPPYVNCLRDGLEPETNDIPAISTSRLRRRVA